MLTPEEIIEKKKKYFFPNTMHFYSAPPHIVKGSGKYLFDSEGKRYLDFFAGVTVVNCGHCNKEINEQIKKQIDTLQHTSIIYLTENMVRLAERLAGLLPGDIHNMFFCSSGSEANDGAMELARLHTGKRGFLAFDGGLHGRTTLTLSATGIPMWRIDPFLTDEPVWFAKSYAAKWEDREAAADAALTSAEEILAAHGNDIAACIAEPIQGNGGINVPPQNFFVRLKELLAAHGVLLIMDEIQTGFGRTGYMFASEHFNIVPDIISFAKALGNGAPVGGFAATPAVAASFTKPSSSTLGGNPVSMAAGLAVIDYMEKHQLCSRAKELGEYFFDKLKAIQSCQPLVADVRGLGLMLGMALNEPAKVDIVLERLKDKGIIIGKNGMNREVLVFQPPLIIEKSDIDTVCAELETALAQA